MNLSSAGSAALPLSGWGLLRDLVHERTGLYFDDGKTDMLFQKLLPLIKERGLKSLLTYYYLLKYDPGAAEEWWRVFDALAVQESYFWREMDQIRLLVDEFVPRFFQAHPEHTLDIWSAGCSAGQEPLTIAMALLEAGWFDRARINICASDASPQAVQAAKNGLYRERSFRSLPPELREKYFVPEDGCSRVRSDLQSRVCWRIANLVSEPDLAASPLGSPVIFCRNVFIYFSESAVRKTVRAFAQRMPREGYLFVGTADSLKSFTTDFELREIGGAFVYTRS